MSCSAVIVTRGDVDLSPILETLPFDDVIVWDNLKRNDEKVYGRYEAILEMPGDYVYTQDDDCVLPESSIMALAAAAGRGHVVCNVTPAHRRSYEPIGIGLVGWGAVFHREAPFAAFRKYLAMHAAPTWLQVARGPWPMDDMFLRECDRVFTGLTPIRWMELPFDHMPHAGNRNKMFYDACHQSDFAEVKKRIEALR